MDPVQPNPASTGAGADGSSGPRWKPLSPRQRRVLGVLVEKAKTTPDAYPMTVNAIVAGCNQKSNRSPLMNLSPEDVEDVLRELRALGAAAEIQQGGRVARYRHYMYEWLGVDKYELAVMTELMLRGEQTVGELRSRAARMEPIADLQALRPVLQSLAAKQLIIALSPEGRGQVVTHNLYKERELTELRARYGSGGTIGGGSFDEDTGAEPPAQHAAPLVHSIAPPPRPVAAAMPAPAAPAVTLDMFNELQVELAELRAELARMRTRIEQLESDVRG